MLGWAQSQTPHYSASPVDYTTIATVFDMAVGFLHPALVSVGAVGAYVQGLRAMGYVFADPRQFGGLRN